MSNSELSKKLPDFINSLNSLQISFSYNPELCPKPERSCDICPLLIETDKEILSTLESFAGLLNKRKSLRDSVNKRHDPFGHLPVEIVSEIFRLCCMDTVSKDPVGPIHLAAVCQGWRSVTIENPQLWSTLVISASTANMYNQRNRDIRVLGNLLSRSKCLPLSLYVTLKLVPEWSTKRPSRNDNPVAPIIDELRRHSDRWKSVTFGKMSNRYFILDLFKDLKSDFEVIIRDWDIGYPQDSNEEGLFHPMSLRLEDVKSIRRLPFGWKYLTSLTVSKEFLVTELVEIIRNAPNLLFCDKKGGLGSAPSADLLSLMQHQPAVSSLTCLHIDSQIRPEENLLRFVKLPSIKTLHCQYDCCHSYGRQDFDVLNSFVERSEFPSITEFHLSITHTQLLRCKKLRYTGVIPLTSLELDTSGITLPDRRSVITSIFFQSLLAKDIRERKLPELRRLLFKVPLTSEFWEDFFTLFSHELNPETSNNSDDFVAANRPRRSRNSLETVYISLPDKFCKALELGIDASVLARLAEIETTGVNIVFRHENSEYCFSTAFNELS